MSVFNLISSITWLLDEAGRKTSKVFLLKICCIPKRIVWEANLSVEKKCFLFIYLVGVLPYPRSRHFFFVRVPLSLGSEKWLLRKEGHQEAPSRKIIYTHSPELPSSQKCLIPQRSFRWHFRNADTFLLGCFSLSIFYILSKNTPGFWWLFAEIHPLTEKQQRNDCRRFPFVVRKFP